MALTTAPPTDGGISNCVTLAVTFSRLYRQNVVLFPLSSCSAFSPTSPCIWELHLSNCQCIASVIRHRSDWECALRIFSAMQSTLWLSGDTRKPSKGKRNPRWTSRTHSNRTVTHAAPSRSRRTCCPGPRRAPNSRGRSASPRTGPGQGGGASAARAAPGG